MSKSPQMPSSTFKFYLNKTFLQIDNALLSEVVASPSSISNKGQLFLNFYSAYFEEYILYSNMRNAKLIDKCIDITSVGNLYMLTTLSYLKSNLIHTLLDSCLLTVLRTSLKLELLKKNQIATIINDTTQTNKSITSNCDKINKHYTHMQAIVNQYFQKLEIAVNNYNNILNRAYDGKIQYDRRAKLRKLVGNKRLDQVKKELLKDAPFDKFLQQLKSSGEIRIIRIVSIAPYQLNSRIKFWNEYYDDTLDEDITDHFKFFKYFNRFQQLEFVYFQKYANQQPAPSHVRQYLTLHTDPLFLYVQNSTANNTNNTTNNYYYIYKCLSDWTLALNKKRGNIYAFYFIYTKLTQITDSNDFWAIIAQIIIYYAHSYREDKQSRGLLSNSLIKLYKFFDTDTYNVSILNPLLSNVRTNYKNQLLNVLPYLREEKISDICVSIIRSQVYINFE